MAFVDMTLAAYDRARRSGAGVSDAVDAARDFSNPLCQRNPAARTVRPPRAAPRGNPFGSISDGDTAAGLTVRIGPLTGCPTAFAVAKAYAAAGAKRYEPVTLNTTGTSAPHVLAVTCVRTQEDSPVQGPGVRHRRLAPMKPFEIAQEQPRTRVASRRRGGTWTTQIPRRTPETTDFRGRDGESPGRLVRGIRRASGSPDTWVGQMPLTFSAWGPLGPCVTSNSTFWPSCSSR